MLLAVAVFLWAAALGAGDGLPFSGRVRALRRGAGHRPGSLPGALLAGVVDRQGDRDRHEGDVLWLVEPWPPSSTWPWRRPLRCRCSTMLGYTPGTRDPAALHTLGLAYALLPCTLKLLAAAGLYLLILRPSTPADLPAAPLIRRTP